MEFSDQPAAKRMLSKLTPKRAESDVAAWRVLYGLNWSIFIPRSFRIVLIHLLIVCEDALWCGFLYVIKRYWQNPFNSLVLSKYCNKTLATQISG